MPTSVIRPGLRQLVDRARQIVSKYEGYEEAELLLASTLKRGDLTPAEQQLLYGTFVWMHAKEASFGGEDVRDYLEETRDQSWGPPF